VTLTVESIVLSLASAIIGGLVVAIANHWMTQSRENRKAKADISLKYRVEAWRKVDSIHGLDKDLTCLESAVADVLLFGTDEEIELAKKVAQTAGRKGTTDTTELLVVLRKNIRSDLGLSATATHHFWFRADYGRKPTHEAEA